MGDPPPRRGTGPDGLRRLVDGFGDARRLVDGFDAPARLVQSFNDAARAPLDAMRSAAEPPELLDRELLQFDMSEREPPDLSWLRVAAEDRARELEVLEDIREALRGREAPAASPAAARGAPAHRAPTETPLDVAQRLEHEVDHRLADPRNGALSQESIAKRCGCTRTLVRKAIGLRRAGWPLARSDPDFSPTPGFVRLPSVKKARKTLVDERRARRNPAL